MSKIMINRNGRGEITSYRVSLKKALVEKLGLQGKEVKLVETEEGILLKKIKESEDV